MVIFLVDDVFSITKAFFFHQLHVTLKRYNVTFLHLETKHKIYFFTVYPNINHIQTLEPFKVSRKVF